MAINLTKNQIEIAHWLRAQHLTGSLPETFTVHWKHKNYVPETGTIVEIKGQQPDITYATMKALENSGLLLTTHTDINPGQKSGARKTGQTAFVFGWPKHETSRTFTLLGSILTLLAGDSRAQSELNRDITATNVDSLGESFIDPALISQLREAENRNFDVARLSKYCEEINDNFRHGNYSSVVFLARAILDHCPPIFGQPDFDQVAAQGKGASFKKVAGNLNLSLKKIADHHIHKQIGKKEIPPVKNEIDFSSDLNFLLARIVETL